jgi:8-oxo-dGTP diphosphatase
MKPIHRINNDSLNHVHVACAIIERNDTILAAQRSESMNLPFKWEFPGGKIRAGESPEECLKRELIEEMAIHVTVNNQLVPMTHRYQKFTVTLYPFICTIISGEITLNEHAAIAWLLPSEMLSLDWAAADIPVIKAYLKTIRRSKHNEP